MVSARLLQGFACGGNWGSNGDSRRERAGPQQRLVRELADSQPSGGVLLGAMVTMLVSLSMTQAQLEAWGWRLPFAFGLLIVPVGFYVR